ncbi:hypothetical protein O181_034865 [Austropuccinia psidii MF-1]|uniref:Integrase catalytic domain-containing protein n=1 Tax=Austropuccinia psidii MF-1 TaxID=1389203 RepID=A0A9Q3D3S2_9BASI|nr:hypothetical protein [Austropuccinia psidii MF-1]
MLGKKLEFPTAYHPQTDGLAESMIQTMKDIVRRFCAYGLEYKDHKGYTHDWVTVLTPVQLAYNTIQQSTTGKSPSLVEKWWNPLFPVDHLKKKLLTIHPTSNYFHDISKRSCHTASHRKNAAGVRITQEFSQKHPEFPVTLVKPYFQTGEEKVPSKTKTTNPPYRVQVEDSCGPLKKIIKEKKTRLSVKDQKQHLVSFKSQTENKDIWWAEDGIPDGNLHVIRLRASRGTEQSHQL